MRSTPLIAAALLALVACTSSETTEPVPDPDGPPAPDPDPPPPDPEPEPSACEQLGWTERAFIWDGLFGYRRRDLAFDFVVPELLSDGSTRDWVFSEMHLGCETYLFVPDTLTVSPLDPTPLLESAEDLATLIAIGPPNAHYFFVDRTGPPEEVAAFAGNMVARIDGVLAALPEADRVWWREHLHVINQAGDTIDSWIATSLTQGGAGFAIDRFQRIRAYGNLADVNRFDPQLNNAGFWPWRENLSYVAHEALYYNHESDRQDMLDAVEWDAVWLFYEENIHSSGKNIATVTLPDAATMGTYDTLLIDLSHVCDPFLQEQGNCDAWDAIQALRLCDADDPDDCSVELARYITTYHREGRWLADASQLLPHLAAGGSQRLLLNGAREGHFVSMRLLFANTGKGGAPYDIQALWEGGSWNDEYDANHPPLEVTIPADATKVFLTAVLSGHGQGGQFNCAEFCDHQHSFTVGGETFVADHPNMGDQEGCLNQIDLGTVPNQHGTWWFERSSWCPGKQVDPWVWDITDQVTPGETVTISYTTNHGTPDQGGNIFLRTWLTAWK